MASELSAFDVLKNIGMHPKYKGFKCILDILRITCDNSECVYQMSRMVYPILTEKYGCTKSSIERNIRFAILRTWESGNAETLKEFFGAYVRGWVPTNAEFIAVVTMYLTSGDNSEYEQLTLPVF